MIPTRVMNTLYRNHPRCVWFGRHRHPHPSLTDAEVLAWAAMLEDDDLLRMWGIGPLGLAAIRGDDPDLRLRIDYAHYPWNAK